MKVAKKLRQFVRPLFEVTLLEIRQIRRPIKDIFLDIVAAMAPDAISIPCPTVKVMFSSIYFHQVGFDMY